MMNGRVEAVLEQAKQLSREEQAVLADAMHELVSPHDPDWEAAWVKECQDRLAAYERGEMEACDSDEVMARLRKKFGLK
jgi:putative addiction module component (TIGR02574 family)